MSNALAESVERFDAQATEAPSTDRPPRMLSARERELFAGAARREQLEAGRAVFRRGEFGRSMFVIESGHVLLESAGEAPDKLLGPGEYFGELALFAGSQARSGSALATEPCVVYVVDPESFRAVLQREPLPMAQFMLRSFADLVASEQQSIASYERRHEDLSRTLEALRQNPDQMQLARQQVCTDDLTGLCNRRGLYRFLANAKELRDRHRRFGLLLIDVDHFKQINDQHGHLVADDVLCAVASVIQEAAGPTDLPCRLGGDEFALLSQVAEHIELSERASRITAGIRQVRFPRTAPALVVTVSVGGGLCPENSDWSAWYSEADCALYHVKGSGGDGAHVMG